MTDPRSCEQKDWASNPQLLWAIWGLPVFALVGAMFVAPPLKALIWTIALAWMGVACLANAARCGRVHCHFTGPLYLVLAALSLLHGLDIVSLGPHGWQWLGFAAGAGTVVLWWLPERVWGKFARRGRTRHSPA